MTRRSASSSNCCNRGASITVTAIGPVNLYDVAASILAELGETIRSKAQDVVLSGCETAWVKTDEALLRLLLENILENAVKYPRHPAGSM